MIKFAFNHDVEIAGSSPESEITMWYVGINMDLEKKIHEPIVPSRERNFLARLVFDSNLR